MTSLAIFSVNFPPQDGGISMYAQGLARALNRAGVEVVVIAGMDAPEDMQYDQRLKFPVIRFPRVENKLRNLRYRLQAVGACIRDYGPRAYLATEWFRTGIVLWLWSWIADIRYSVAAHGNDVLVCQESGWKRALCRRVMGRADWVFPVSRSTENLLRDLFPGLKRVHRIPNGIEPSDLSSETSPEQVRSALGLGEKPVLFSLGRLVKRKGHDVILRSLPQVLEDVPDLVWLIAGKGDQEGPLRAQASKMGLSGRVRFLGYIDTREKGAYYHACDVYALMPRTIEAEMEIEGFGITFLEASYCGCPIVAGRSGGVPDAVVDGVTGLLVDPEDPREVGRAIVSLFADPSWARQLGMQGRERVEEHFTWDRAAERLLSVWADVPGAS